MTTFTNKTYTRFVRLSAVLALTLGLSACFKSNPPVKIERYRLPEVTAPTPTSAVSSTQTLVLNHIKLADYLDSDRIVIQLDDITMQPARDHLWVDTLAQELRRGLHARLSSRISPAAVIDGQPSLPTKTSKLNITIDQFQGQMQGYAVISGHWQLGEAPLQPHPFYFKTALDQDGYPALVRALGRNLDLLSEQIADQWQKSLAEIK